MWRDGRLCIAGRLDGGCHDVEVNGEIKGLDALNATEMAYRMLYNPSIALYRSLL